MRLLCPAGIWGLIGGMCTSPLVGGELGPRPQADLPPLLKFADGRCVLSPRDWPHRRAEIARLMCECFIGDFPKGVPLLLRAQVLQEAAHPDGSTRRRVELTFATRNKVSMMADVWVPKGGGPFPVLLTAPRFYQVPWAELALSRGYLVCLYPGVDSHHNEPNYPGYESVWKKFQAEYPEATWTEISTKGWIASRTLDYLLNPKYGYKIAQDQVGIIGHSRYGKQAMIAAAFDERITSVVARSPGTPASCAYRFASRPAFSEAPDDWPDQWFLQSLRSCTGREDELPIDSHGWMALIAPRRCMIHTAHNDDGDPTFGVERTYLEGRKVYELLGHPENLRLVYRTGGHDPITDEHRRQNIDWFDLSFGRGRARQTDFPETFIHRFDWNTWKSRLGAEDLRVQFATSRSSDDPHDRRARILWSLGTPPGDLDKWTGQYTFLSDDESELMTHDRWRVEGTARMPVSFADNVRGNIYCNPSIRGPAPAVIWLHPYSYASGYNEGYGVIDTTIYHRLAKAGFVVLAYDQCGFGLRLLEGRDFYGNYPKWSRLGRMVYDVWAAVDFLIEGKGRPKGRMPAIRRDRVFLLGYSLGGMVGLYAAALDKRIAGVASFCGFTPLRTDTDDKPTGGNRRLWEWHALQPLLGLFHGREQDIPYDFDDVLSLIAPRACLIVAPKRDRYADFAEVARCVEAARPAWTSRAAGQNLTLLSPDDINRFQTPQQKIALKWLTR
jgi:pimeloyl-ACP methyl ester carboxylesterase